MFFKKRIKGKDRLVKEKKNEGFVRLLPDNIFKGKWERHTQPYSSLPLPATPPNHLLKKLQSSTLTGDGNLGQGIWDPTLTD